MVSSLPARPSTITVLPEARRVRPSRAVHRYIHLYHLDKMLQIFYSFGERKLSFAFMLQPGTAAINGSAGQDASFTFYSEIWALSS